MRGERTWDAWRQVPDHPLPQTVRTDKIKRLEFGLTERPQGYSLDRVESISALSVWMQSDEDVRWNKYDYHLRSRRRGNALRRFSYRHSSTITFVLESSYWMKSHDWTVSLSFCNQRWMAIGEQGYLMQTHTGSASYIDVAWHCI